MTEYKIGDKVVMVIPYDSAEKGMIGIIKYIDDDIFDIEFESDFNGGHDCNDHCATNRGQYVTDSINFKHLTWRNRLQ